LPADSQHPRIAVCTLAEGRYHYGTGALANSLHRSGFRGTFYVGCRGELPSWSDGAEIVELPGGMHVEFVRMAWKRNPNFEKSSFMLDLLDRDAGLDSVAYFDSDVVVRADWQFFEEWSARGVGLCMDYWPTLVPENHPWRLAWAEVAADMGCPVRPIDYYCNAGFALVPRQHRSFLEVWALAVDHVLEVLADGNPVQLVKYGETWMPFSRSDQDAMAIAMMGTSVPLSIVGPDGMSFASGANVMSHAVNSPKPWDRRYLRDAVLGRPPLRADREYWRHARGPIRLFDQRSLRMTEMIVKVATALGTIYRRPEFLGTP
jgi:hypothetical protein